MNLDLPLAWLAIRGTGLTAWILLSLTVMWGLLIRSRLITVGSPLRMFELHKWFGALGLGFLIVHLVAVWIDPTLNFSVVNVLVPFTADWRPVAIAFGIVAFYLMIPVSVVGRIRARLGKRANSWFKWSHRAAYAAWPLATAHYLLAGTDALTSWAITVTVVVTVSLAAVLTTRGWRPRGALFTRSR